MKCLETRRTPEGFKRRRYQADDGTRVTTIEVPIEVWRASQREARRQSSQLRRPAALRLLRQGLTPAQVALELGISERTVIRLKDALRAACPSPAASP